MQEEKDVEENKFNNNNGNENSTGGKYLLSWLNFGISLLSAVKKYSVSSVESGGKWLQKCVIQFTLYCINSFQENIHLYAFNHILNKLKCYLWPKIDNFCPMALENPKSFCFLNSVLQVLYGCRDFAKEIEQYHFAKDSIAKDISELFNVMENKDSKHVTKLIEKIQNYFNPSEEGDDIHTCFSTLLSKINASQKTSSKRNRSKDFEEQKKTNFSLLFENFYGQVKYEDMCSQCDNIHTNIQVISSIPLYIKESTEPQTLEEVFRLTHEDSLLDADEGCCEKAEQFQRTTFLVLPKYLFLYLNRGSYELGEDKKKSLVTTNGRLKITIDSGKDEFYTLVASIDHIGSSDGGHYYCFCNFERPNKCWLLSDTQVELMKGKILENMISASTTGFLFKKI